MNKYSIIYVTCNIFIILPLLQLEVSPAHVILLNQREGVDEISHNLQTFMFPLETHAYGLRIAVLFYLKKTSNLIFLNVILCRCKNII